MNRRRSLLWIESISTVGWTNSSDISVSESGSTLIRYIKYTGSITTGATITSNDSWVTINIQNETQVLIKVSENTSSSSRSTKVTLSPPEGCDIIGNNDINITQKGVQYYTLTKSSTSGGSISVSPDKSQYLKGEVVTVTATPDSNYVFAGFSDNSSETSDSIGVSINPSTTKTITILGNETVRAVFRNFIYVLAESELGQTTTLMDDSGTYIGELSSSPSIKLYKSGTLGSSDGNIILRIKPSLVEPYGTYNVEPYGMTLTGSVDYNALGQALFRMIVVLSTTRSDQYWKYSIFDKSTKMVDLTTSAYIKESADGSISTSGGGTTSPSSYSGQYGSTVSVSATPYSGYKFLSWDDGGSQTHNAILNVTQTIWTSIPDRLTKTLTAYFTPTSSSITTYTVSVYSDNSSMGTVSPSSKTVESGGSATFNLYPKSGYKYSSIRWSGWVNGTASVDSGSNVLTVSSVTGSCTLYVNWEKDEGGTEPTLYATLTLGTSSGGVGDRGCYAFPVNTSSSISSYSDSDFIGNSVWDFPKNSYSYKYGSEVALCALDLEDGNLFTRWSDGNTSPFRVLTMTSDITIYPIFTSSPIDSSTQKSELYLNGSSMNWNIYKGYPIFALIKDSDLSKPSSVSVNSVSYTKFMFILEGGYRIPIMGDGSSRINITTT